MSLRPGSPRGGGGATVLGRNGEGAELARGAEQRGSAGHATAAAFVPPALVMGQLANR